MGATDGRASRTDRIKQVRKAGAGRERRRTFLVWLGVAATLVVVAGGLGLATRDSDSGAPPSGQAPSSPDDLSEVEEFGVTSDHVTGPVEYEQTPPAGGAHNPIWLNCGVYDQPVPDENAVHSMEHGAVWITYDPALPEAEIAQLRDATPSTYAILSPFDGLPDPVVVSAWGAQLRLDGVDDPRLPAFISTYRMGGNAPEIGASCTGASDGTWPLDASGGM